MDIFQKNIAQKEWKDYDANDFLSAQDKRIYRRMDRRRMKKDFQRMKKDLQQETML